MFNTQLDWHDPRLMAASVSELRVPMVFLYSSTQVSFSGRYSFLGWGVHDQVSDHWDALESQLSSDKKTLENAWFGYLGYELLHQCETLPVVNQSQLDLPDLLFFSFKHLIRYDHELKQCVCLSREEGTVLPEPASEWSDCSVVVSQLGSNMTKESYLSHVKSILEAIQRGDLCQANLTRKFFGKIQLTGTAMQLFLKLCEISASSYSAALFWDDTWVLSSSPEQFLTINAEGQMESRPIKGTSARFEDPKKDQDSRHQLQDSEKDRAENLMIVDLMRHDFSRSAIPGSVTVPQLFQVSTYQTIHHMSSTIRAEKNHSVSTLSAVKCCFPPGSMTGTPKIQAMRLCAEKEQWKRGVYSGALGYFGGDGSVDLSVVIRTLILQGDQFEFQVGGAIVADSDPEKEWEETLVKAKGISELLGVDKKELAF